MMLEEALNPELLDLYGAKVAERADNPIMGPYFIIEFKDAQSATSWFTASELRETPATDDAPEYGNPDIAGTVEFTDIPSFTRPTRVIAYL